MQDGTMKVVKVDTKVFVGKDILHAAVFRKNDKRTTYNMIYRDGPRGNYYVKRFAVTSVTRDKDYDLTAGTENSKVEWFTANPNGEAEVIQVHVRPKPKLKKLKFEFDFAEQAIKGRGAKGNTLSKNPLRKIEFKEKGLSTLGARKIWFDDTVQRLNAEGRGELLGEFAPEDKILTMNQQGEYKLLGFDLSTQFDDDMILIEKWNPEKPVSAVYFDSDKKVYMIKRFLVEKSTKPVEFVPEGDENQLELVTSDWKPRIQINYRKKPGEDEAQSEEVNVEEFIAVKGVKAKGNILTKETVNTIDLLNPIPYEPPTKEGDNDDEEKPPSDDGSKEAEEATDSEESTTVELEVEDTTAKEEKPKAEKKEEKKESKPKKDDTPPPANGGDGQLGLF
jgi:topoisomerase-4 subunit A